MSDVRSWPDRDDCARPGCGHTSDVHVLVTDGPVRLSVTDTALAFPCESVGCSCASMIRSPENYFAMTDGQR